MDRILHFLLRFCILFGIYIPPPKSRLIEVKTFVPASFHKRPLCFSLNSTRFNHITCIYSGLLTLTICALYVHALLGSDIVPTLPLTWVATLAIYTIQLCTNILIIMESVFRGSQHAAFLQLLEQLEASFKLRLRQDVRKPVPHLQHFICNLFVFSFFPLAFFIITSHWLDFIGFFWHGLWSILTLRVRIIQILVYVRLLQHYLACLCVTLQQIVAYRLSPQQIRLNQECEQQQSLECLLAVKEIYTSICKAFALLNYFAGWSLFGIVICYMLDATCNIYWTLMSVNGFPNRRYYFIAGPLTFLPLVVIIWYLCYLCEKCKASGSNINHLLNKIKISSYTVSLASHRLLLNEFCSQLQLQRIEVTAQNFFTLDCQLLMTIIHVTASSLVILVQFLLFWLDLVGGNVLRDGTLKIVGWYNSTL